MVLGYKDGVTYKKTVDPDAEGGLARGPSNELGNPFIFDAGRLSAWQASIATSNEVSQDLSLYARVSANEYGESETLSASLWDVAPFIANPGVGTPLGGVVPVGHLQSGHLGTTDDWYFNMLTGGSHRVAFVGSVGKFSTILVPKYFLADDTNPLRTYDVTAGQPLDPTDWNMPTPTLLENTLGGVPSQAQVFVRKAMSHAWFGQGHTEIDTSSRTTRKFFGSLKATAVAFGTGTLVPVAYGATHVRLNGIGLRGATVVPLSFFQVPRGDLTAVVDERYAGPFPGIGTPNQTGDLPVPLIDNVQWLVITTQTPFVGTDVLFEVEYFLGA